MDGFQPYQPGRAAALPALPPARAFRVRDLDAPPPNPDAALAEMERAEQQAMLNAARAEGQALGLAEGQLLAAASREAEVAASLHAMAQALDQAGAAAATTVAQASEALARLLLAALDAALPAASARLAAETATLLAATLRPLLAEGHGVTLAVAPGLGAACAAALGDTRIDVTEDATLAAGDARATWCGGSAAMELARQRDMVAGVLHALGLQGTQDGG